MDSQTKISDLSVDDLRHLIKDTVNSAIEDALEDLLARSSENYISSIKEAREDYLKRNVTSLEDLKNE